MLLLQGEVLVLEETPEIMCAYFLCAYWPSCSVFSSSDLAVFMTSTLFW